MTRHVMLNNIEHKDLRLSARYTAEFGANVGTVLAFPTEFAELLRDYPIFFRKDPTSGEYSSVVLLGFSKDENLFLNGDRWDASYVPGVVARGPFLIGFQERQEGGELRREPVIHVDIEDKRLGTTEGERLFLEQGGNGRALERVAAILNGIHAGIEMSKAMFAAFTAADIIDSINVDVKIGANQRFEVTGLLSISDEKLRNLSPEALLNLHRSGFLEGAYLVRASLNNLNRLVERKLQREQLQSAVAS